MKNGIKIFFILFMVTFICGCSLIQKKDVEVKGYSLEEMGLHIIKDYNIRFKSDKQLYKTVPGFGVAENAHQLNSPIEENYPVHGNLSIIYLYYRDHNQEVYTLPIKYVQGFKKAEIFAENHYAMINSKRYSSSDLKNDVLYEDDQWIVYEITNYLDVLKRHKKINWLGQKTNIDYYWLTGPLYYLDSHLKELITRDENHQYDHINNQHHFILNGYHLEEMGLGLKVDVLFEDPNSKNSPGTLMNYEAIHSEGLVPIRINDETYHLNGNFSIINVNFGSDGRSIVGIPAKYVQGFRRADVEKNEDFVEINSHLYRFDELEKDIIYKDDDWVVYELSDYLGLPDFETKRREFSKNSTFNYDYSWLTEVYIYLDEHLSEMITKK